MDTRTESATQSVALGGGESVCPNCEVAFDPGDEFCPRCGQKRTRPEDLTVSHFLKNTLHELTDLDSKLFRTVRALFFRPGFLTGEYVAGRRESYFSPVKLYLVVSALFFFLAWDAMLEIGRFEQQVRAEPAFRLVPRPKNVDEAVFLNEWFEKAGDYSAWTRFAGVVFFAAFVALLYVRRKDYFVTHLIFSLHYYAFDFLFFTFVVLVMKLAGVLTGFVIPVWPLYACFVVLLWYAYASLRKVYAQSVAKTLLKAIMLILCDAVVTQAGSLLALGASYVAALVKFGF